MLRHIMVAGLLAAAAPPARAAAPDSAAVEPLRRPRPTATAPT